MYIYSWETVGAFVCLVVLSCCFCQVFYKSCFLWQINDDDEGDNTTADSRCCTLKFIAGLYFASYGWHEKIAFMVFYDSQCLSQSRQKWLRKIEKRSRDPTTPIWEYFVIQRLRLVCSTSVHNLTTPPFRRSTDIKEDPKTQNRGHWKWLGSLKVNGNERIRLPVRLHRKICVYLVPFAINSIASY